MKKVAVLLAAYNGSAWIEDQVHSILNQKNVDVDIYISIDFSSDDTLHRIQSIACSHSSIKILPYGDVYGGAAKNFFRLIRDVNFEGYEYISLSDQDDIWMGDKIFRGVSVLELSGAHAYSSDVMAFWSDGRRKLVKKSYPKRRLDYLFESAGPGCTYIFSSSSILKFKRMLIESWDEMNEVALHDWMLYAYYRKNGVEWIIDNKSLMLYRQHEYNQVGVNDGFAAYKKRFGLIKNRWYAGEVKKIAGILSIPLPSKWCRIKYFYELRRRPRDAFGLLFANLMGLF